MVVIVFTVGAAVKPAANSLPEDTKEPEPTPPTTEAVQQEPYPFNLMSLDWSGEELEGWTRYEVPEDYADHGGYFPECMQQFTYIICKQNGVDYALVLAIIETESGYRWDATSSEGSTGYMQVLAKWHEERMHRLNVDNVENPYFNIMVGVDYLAELQERFDTEAEVLTAYNYGVTGAYQHVWNKGLTDTEYSREVQQAKERIERRMRGGLRGKEHGRSRKNASGHIITTPEVVAEDGSRRKGSGTAEDKATMQSAVPGAGIRHGRRGNSW